MRKKLNLIILICVLSFINSSELLAQRTVQAPKFVNDFGDLASVCSTPGIIFTAIANLLPGEALPSDNQFVLELSDATGSFDNPQELDRVDGAISASTIELEIRFENVQIPEDANSDTHRIRVVTSSTGVASAPSDPIPVHFYRNDLSLRINGARNITLCNVVNFVRPISITITDLDDGSSVNPDDFTYEWFKGTILDPVLIPGVTGPTLEVTQNDLDVNGIARFFAQIDFGDCNGQFNKEETNNITVQLIDVADVSIVEGPTVNFCPQDTDKVLNSSVTGFRNDYQWFKDDVAIDGATSTSYNLPDNNFDGMYTLEVRFSDDCTLTTAPARELNVVTTIPTPLLENFIILPAETITLEVTTTAPVSPATSSYQWLRDTSPITGVLSLTTPTVSTDIGNPGTYRIDISADDSCMSMLTSQANVYSPVSIGIEIGPSDDFTCEDSSVILEIKDMFGFTQSGSGAPPQVSLTENQLSLFNFEWYINDQPSGITDRTLDVSTADQNAIYTLRANLIAASTLGEAVSNPLTISIIPANTEITAAPSTALPDGGSVTLSVPQNANYTYEWFRIVDGVEQLIVGASGNTIVVTEEGEYRVRISSGICVQDAEIVIGDSPGPSELIPNLITPGGNSANNNWVLPSVYAESDVEVTIYSQKGIIDFQKSGGYNQEWPSNSVSGANETLYFYIITKSNSVVKKGTITVMR